MTTVVVNTDTYIVQFEDEEVKTVVIADQGPRGITGATGETGPVGSQILVDSGAPSNGVGADSDFYINSANGNYYLKSGGAWTLQGSIMGPTGATGETGPTGATGATGAAGTVWRRGTGAPSSLLGANGDFY